MDTLTKRQKQTVDHKLQHHKSRVQIASETGINLDILNEYIDHKIQEQDLKDSEKEKIDYYLKQNTSVLQISTLTKIPQKKIYSYLDNKSRRNINNGTDELTAKTERKRIKKRHKSNPNLQKTIIKLNRSCEMMKKELQNEQSKRLEAQEKLNDVEECKQLQSKEKELEESVDIFIDRVFDDDEEYQTQLSQFQEKFKQELVKIFKVKAEVSHPQMSIDLTEENRITFEKTECLGRKTFFGVSGFLPKHSVSQMTISLSHDNNNIDWSYAQVFLVGTSIKINEYQTLASKLDKKKIRSIPFYGVKNGKNINIKVTRKFKKSTLRHKKVIDVTFDPLTKKIKFDSSEFEYYQDNIAHDDNYCIVVGLRLKKQVIETELEMGALPMNTCQKVDFLITGLEYKSNKVIDKIQEIEQQQEELIQREDLMEHDKIALEHDQTALYLDQEKLLIQELEIQKTKVNLNQQQEEINKKNEELNKTIKKINKREKQLIKQKEELDASKAIIDANRIKLDDLRLELKEKLDQLRKREEEFEQKQENLKSLKQNVDQSENNLNKQINRLQDRRKSFNRKKKDFGQQFEQEKRGDKFSLQEQINKVEQDRKDLLKKFHEHKQAKRQLEINQKQVGKLQKLLSQDRERLQKKEEKLNRTEIDLNILQDTLKKNQEDLKQQIKEFKIKKSKYDFDIQSQEFLNSQSSEQRQQELKQSIDSTESSQNTDSINISDYNKLKNKMEKQRKDMLRDSHNYEQENEDQQKLLDDFKKQLKKYQEQNKILKTKYSTLRKSSSPTQDEQKQKQYEEQTEEIKALNQTLDKKKQQNYKLKHKNNELINNERELNKTIGDLNKKTHNYEKENLNNRRKIQQLKDESTELKKMKKEIKDMSSKLAKSERNSKSLNNLNKELQEKMTIEFLGLSQQIEEYKEKNSELIENGQETERGLNSEISQLQKKRDDLKEELNNNKNAQKQKYLENSQLNKMLKVVKKQLLKPNDTKQLQAFLKNACKFQKENTKLKSKLSKLKSLNATILKDHKEINEKFIKFAQQEKAKTSELSKLDKDKQILQNLQQEEMIKTNEQLINQVKNLKKTQSSLEQNNFKQQKIIDVMNLDKDTLLQKIQRLENRLKQSEKQVQRLTQELLKFTKAEEKPKVLPFNESYESFSPKHYKKNLDKKLRASPKFATEVIDILPKEEMLMKKKSDNDILNTLLFQNKKLNLKLERIIVKQSQFDNQNLDFKDQLKKLQSQEKNLTNVKDNCSSFQQQLIGKYSKFLEKQTDLYNKYLSSQGKNNSIMNLNSLGKHRVNKSMNFKIDKKKVEKAKFTFNYWNNFVKKLKKDLEMQKQKFQKQLGEQKSQVQQQGQSQTLKLLQDQERFLFELYSQELNNQLLVQDSFHKEERFMWGQERKQILSASLYTQATQIPTPIAQYALPFSQQKVQLKLTQMNKNKTPQSSRNQQVSMFNFDTPLKVNKISINTQSTMAQTQRKTSISPLTEQQISKKRNLSICNYKIPQTQLKTNSRNLYYKPRVSVTTNPYNYLNYNHIPFM